ncbi:unnamed protein product, partial [Durusdinium trenchii]
ELRSLLLGRTVSSGSLRALHAVRRLMRYVTTLGLAQTKGNEDGKQTSTEWSEAAWAIWVQIFYQLNRHVEVSSFTERAPGVAGASPLVYRFDLAQPKQVDAYWT